MADEDELPAPDSADVRTLALSDGVFAIALTLLVLSIDVPDLRPGDRLGSALWDHAEEVLSWLLSFVVIGAAWARHRELFRGVRRVDTTLTRLNLAYLAVVAFLPYPTQLLGDYSHRPAAVCLYAVTIALLSALGGAMGEYALRAGALSAAGAARQRGQPPWWLVPALFLVAVPLAFPFGSSALLIWFLLPALARTARRPAE